MCRLASYCVYDSLRHSVCTLTVPGSSGRLSIRPQPGERLLVYDLEAYLGEKPIKRPDFLLIGRVGEGPWVVVLVEIKSGRDWKKALDQFREVLPALGRGGESGGDQHHQECRNLLPLSRDHQVIAVVVGQVGRESRKYSRPAPDRRWQEKRQGIPWGVKRVRLASPIAGKTFPSLRDFWIQIGVLPQFQREA